MACGNDPTDNSAGGRGGCDTCEQLSTISRILSRIYDTLNGKGSLEGSPEQDGGQLGGGDNRERLDSLLNYGVSLDLLQKKGDPKVVRDKTEERVAELKRTLGENNVRARDEAYFRTLGAREQNNLISKYNRLGNSAGAVAERMSTLSEGDASLTTRLMSSASMLNPQQQVLLAEGKGVYKEFAQSVKEFKAGTASYSKLGVSLEKSIQSANRQAQLPHMGGVLGASVFGGIAMGAGIAQGYLENPVQSASSGASRYTSTYSQIGKGIGSLAGLAMFIPGVGLVAGAGLGLAGSAVGGLAGSAVGVGSNTGKVLSLAGIGGDLAYSVGKDPSQAVESNYQARMFTASNTNLTRENITSLREASRNSALLGTLNMDNASRMTALQSVLLANRLPLGAGEGAMAMQENAKLGFSLSQYASALGMFSQAPSVIGGEKNVFSLGTQYLEQENNPMARRGMVSYANMGKIDQMTTDAISQAIFGTGVEGLGKMSKEDILSMANKSVGGMSMLNSVLGTMGSSGQAIWDTASGVVSGKAKDADKTDEEFVKALKELTNAINENTKKVEKKKFESTPVFYRDGMATSLLY